MYTIRNVSEAQTDAALELCLHCKKNVATTPALGTLEVNDADGTLADGTLVGYLHSAKDRGRLHKQPTIETTLPRRSWKRRHRDLN
jgi:hypothetical protein